MFSLLQVSNRHYMKSWVSKGAISTLHIWQKRNNHDVFVKCLFHLVSSLFPIFRGIDPFPVRTVAGSLYGQE